MGFRLFSQLLYFLLLLCAPQSFAITGLPILEENIQFSYFNSNFGASPPLGVDSQTNKGVLATLIGLQLKNEGLDPIFLQSLPDQTWAMSQMDALYLKADYSQMILLKAGVTPVVSDKKNSSSTLMNRVIKIGGGFLYHGRTPGGFGYALFFKGFAESKIRVILKKMMSTLTHTFLLFPHHTHHAQRFHLPDLISPVYAEDCNKTLWEGIPSMKEVNDALQHISTHRAAQFTAGCLMGVFKGAWNSTGGAVVDAAHLAKETSSNVVKAMNDPQGSARKLWEDTGKTVDAVGAFFKDFSTFAKEVYPGLMNMDPKIVGDLICETAASAGTASLLVYLTAGIGSPVSVSAIAQSLNRLENTDKFRTTLKTAKASTGPMNKVQVRVSTPKAETRTRVKESEAITVLNPTVKVPAVSQANELDLLTRKLSEPSLNLTAEDIENIKKWTDYQSNLSTFSSPEEKQRIQSFAEALKKAQETYNRNAYSKTLSQPTEQKMELLDSIPPVPRSYSPNVKTPVRKIKNPKAAEAYSEWQ